MEINWIETKYHHYPLLGKQVLVSYTTKFGDQFVDIAERRFEPIYGTSEWIFIRQYKPIPEDVKVTHWMELPEVPELSIPEYQ